MKTKTLLSTIALASLFVIVPMAFTSKTEAQNQTYSLEAFEGIHEIIAKTSTGVSTQAKVNMPYALPNVELYVDYGTGNHEAPTQMDINGDGLSDLVFSKRSGYDMRQYVMLNRGNEFEIVYTCKGKIWGGEYDGMCADHSGGSVAPEEHLVQPMMDIKQEVDQLPAKAHVEASAYALPETDIRMDSRPIIIDMNNDGLGDIVYAERGNKRFQYVLLNTTNGFQIAYTCKKDGYPPTYKGSCASDTAPSSGTNVLPFMEMSTYFFSLPQSPQLAPELPYILPNQGFSQITSNTAGPRITDMNGDSLVDLAYSYNSEQWVMINTGSGFEIEFSCRRFGGGSQSNPFTYAGTCAQ